MAGLLCTVLGMSLTGSYVIVAVMLARLALKKAPKTISYALWLVVGFRLISPFSFESRFSLVPNAGRGIFSPGQLPDRFLLPDGAATPAQTVLTVAATVWLLGLAAMLGHGLVVAARLARRLCDGPMAAAAASEPNVHLLPGLSTPFVFGVVRPRIYIPAALSDAERRFVVLHERTHIRRLDHLIKIAAHLILCLHWFNPLVWLAYRLMEDDMELSCDESVLARLGNGVKADYSRLLLSMATRRRIATPSLAFSAVAVKSRIKNVLAFRRPACVVVAAALVFAAVLGTALITNRTISGSTADAADPTGWDITGWPQVPISAGSPSVEKMRSSYVRTSAATAVVSPGWPSVPISAGSPSAEKRHSKYRAITPTAMSSS